MKKETYLALSSFFQKKSDYFIDAMKQTRFNLFHSSGSYFICGSYERISDEPDRDFCIRLTKEAGVTTYSRVGILSVGQGQQSDSILFWEKGSTLEKAVERLMKV